MGSDAEANDPPRIYLSYAHRRTLPPALRAEFRDLDQLMRTIAGSATDQLLLVAPYLSVIGAEHLQESIAMSAARGAAVKVVTGDITNRGLNYRALQALGKGDAAATIKSRVRILTASELLPSFVHAKLIVADRRQGYLGSANLSGRAMDDNFEVGVRLTASQARSLDKLFVYLEAVGKLVDRTTEIWGDTNR